MSIQTRLQKLEARTPGNRLDDIPEEVLKRFGFLTSKSFATSELDLSEQSDLLAISAEYRICGAVTLEDWDQLIEALRNHPEYHQQHQAHVNKFARDDLEYRPFATEKTWCSDSVSPRVAAKCWVMVEQSSMPKKKRERAADLLRRRARNLRLHPEEIDWLVGALQGLDLGPEGPWVRDHLEGGSIDDG